MSFTPFSLVKSFAKWINDSCFPINSLFYLPLDILLSGFNVETVEYKNISFTVWDVGGQDKVHGLFHPSRC